MGKHHAQIARSGNIALVTKWVREFREEHGDKAHIDRGQLSRKIQLIIGASREKADEYMVLVLGEQ